jgi:hypothetical protein
MPTTKNYTSENDFLATNRDLRPAPMDVLVCKNGNAMQIPPSEAIPEARGRTMLALALFV